MNKELLKFIVVCAGGILFSLTLAGGGESIPVIVWGFLLFPGSYLLTSLYPKETQKK